MAEVKGVIGSVVLPGGRVVLNARDPDPWSRWPPGTPRPWSSSPAVSCVTGLPSLAGKLVHRTREESLALIRALTAQLPANTPQLAYFRNYESAPEGDLDLLVAELQALTEKE